MTFSTTLFVISWICFFVFADKKKIIYFYPTCLLATYFSAAVDFLFTEHYPLWDYPHGTKMQTYIYHLMQQFGIYPVVTYLFLQTIPKRKTKFKLIRHIFYWTLLAIFIEWLAITTHFMEHMKWWNLGYSYTADWLLFFLFYGHFRWWNKKLQE
ncbi:CBO0543 family protein [Ammoniphilus resinae]|uniref:Uncharacterized protein n=1 Tax=Ammoniphilus resinae TaxID=861532 RepID=A0ABS4GVE8_9BACL|nr:CBO0543 family protein [Ammoniphilus resinae]MBP1934239.1 hypothetical protein [Ammoniphilus resinae]